MFYCRFPLEKQIHKYNENTDAGPYLLFFLLFHAPFATCDVHNLKTQSNYAWRI